MRLDANQREKPRRRRGFSRFLAMLPPRIRLGE
jgi:hypothetical protein